MGLSDLLSDIQKEQQDEKTKRLNEKKYLDSLWPRVFSAHNEFFNSLEELFKSLNLVTRINRTDHEKNCYYSNSDKNYYNWEDYNDISIRGGEWETVKLDRLLFNQKRVFSSRVAVVVCGSQYCGKNDSLNESYNNHHYLLYSTNFPNPLPIRFFIGPAGEVKREGLSFSLNDYDIGLHVSMEEFNRLC